MKIEQCFEKKPDGTIKLIVSDGELEQLTIKQLGVLQTLGIKGNDYRRVVIVRQTLKARGEK